ncbi:MULTISPECIES: hypothetical protein [unclassified Microcoleus]|uniref:hypothetical protein n=1 Tax=unclassified Microcoleus TaxID=2642155 RepID=UPI002FD22E3A
MREIRNKLKKLLSKLLAPDRRACAGKFGFDPSTPTFNAMTASGVRWLLKSLLARSFRVFEPKALVDIARKLALLANSI